MKGNGEVKLTEDDLRVWNYICENPGCYMKECALLLGKEHSIYGKQRAASLSIARLRRAGKIVDCRRCPYCKRALTRRPRSVPLYPIINGEVAGMHFKQETFW